MKTNIKRSELYERVWQTPLTRLAKEFDISDVGLAKACRAHNIPTPRPGYWTQLEHGKAPAQTPLPAGEDTVVTLEPSRHRVQLPEAAIASTAVAQAGLVASVLPLADFPSKLAAHSGETFQALKTYKGNESGFLRSRSRTAFTCDISSATRDRAVRLLDAIERTVTNIGGLWKADKDSAVLRLEFEGITLSFSLSEKYKRTERQKQTWSYLQQYDYHFSGDLTLILEGDYATRRTLSDGKRARLEEKLSEFAAAAHNTAEAIKERREELEARRRLWEEEAKIRQEAETKARHLSEFKKYLLAEANAWTDFKRVSEYVAHLERLLAEVPTDATSEQQQTWMAMAKACALSLDPTGQRIERLQKAAKPENHQSPYGPFGQPIIPPKP